MKRSGQRSCGTSRYMVPKLSVSDVRLRVLNTVLCIVGCSLCSRYVLR